MYVLEKIFHFEAGHTLAATGKCARPHGHSFTLTIALCSETLQSDGPEKNMVQDLLALNNLVEPMIDRYLDHRWLNETLENDSPTLEFICRWIYDHLKPIIPQLSSVCLAENPFCKAIYSPS